MPEIKLKHVISCNSEEKGFPADNILDKDPAKKWKCMPGEKNCTVSIQLEKSSQISSLDMGNENSAFIEVLVGKESDKSEDFKTLLPATMFMNPSESRNVQGGSKVRMFKKTDLEKNVADSKWDRIRIVCSQPFNKSIGYGISFFRIQEPEQPLSEDVGLKKEEKSISLGKFKLRVSDDDDEAPGSMFMKRGIQRTSSQETTKELSIASPASAIRAASKIQDVAGMPTKERSPLTTGGKSPYFHNSASQQNSFDRSSNSTTKRSQSQSNDSSTKRSSPEPKRPKVLSQPPESSASASKREKKKSVKRVPLEELLDGVVFVISGIQNPERAEIRQTGLDMGAKYRADWGRDCTHLICAFANTPKYNQVKGKGRIVKKHWLADCYKHKKRLSWRKYAFEKRDVEGTDSENEELLVGDPVKNNEPILLKKAEDKEFIRSNSNEDANQNGSSMLKENDDLSKSRDVYDMWTDENPSSGDEGNNTDEEVERVKERQRKKAEAHIKSPVKKSPTKLEVGPDGLPILPNFFSEFTFVLYGDFSAYERKQLRRFVTAFGGKWEEYMGDSVTHVVTKSKWNDDFDDALNLENAKLIFVKPDWVMECGQFSKLVEIDKYLIEKE